MKEAAVNLTTGVPTPSPTGGSVQIMGVGILLVLMIVVTLGGNAITFLAILSNRQLRYSPYYLLLSLCVADFMVGLTVLPVSLVSNITDVWILGSAVCDVFTFANLLFGSASILNLCAVSWDRYVAVTSPLTYLVRMRDSVVWTIIMCCWTVSASLSGLFTYFIKVSKKRTLCKVKGVDLRYTISIFVVSYVLPVVFLVFVNTKIVEAARRQLKQITFSETGTVSGTSETTCAEPQRRASRRKLRAELKTLKMFLVVTGTFCLCWTPFFVLFVLDGVTEIPANAIYLSLLLVYLNSSFNPFFYGIFNSEIRSVVLNMLACRNR